LYRVFAKKRRDDKYRGNKMHFKFKNIFWNFY
jgi:hypothetical protein